MSYPGSAVDAAKVIGIADSFTPDAFYESVRDFALRALKPITPATTVVFLFSPERITGARPPRARQGGSIRDRHGHSGRADRPATSIAARSDRVR